MVENNNNTISRKEKIEPKRDLTSIFREIVKEYGPTQRKFSETTHLDQATVSNLMTGKLKMNQYYAETIGYFLNIRPEYLLGLSDVKNIDDFEASRYLCRSGQLPIDKSAYDLLLSMEDIEISLKVGRIYDYKIPKLKKYYYNDDICDWEPKCSEEENNTSLKTAYEIDYDGMFENVSLKYIKFFKLKIPWCILSKNGNESEIFIYQVVIDGKEIDFIDFSLSVTEALNDFKNKITTMADLWENRHVAAYGSDGDLNKFKFMHGRKSLSDSEAIYNVQYNDDISDDTEISDNFFGTSKYRSEKIKKKNLKIHKPKTGDK